MDDLSVSQYAEQLRGYLDEELVDVTEGEWFEVPVQDRLAFERRLYDSPWYGVWLPSTVGGDGRARTYEIAFERELAGAGVSDRIARVGQNLLLPTLLEFGTSEQIAEYGTRTARGETLWCQGFSEPDAGSDLASVRTRATQVDGGFVINGQKTWTSLAHLADHCFCLARTDAQAQKHRGLSVLLVDMRADGIQHRPIDQIDGGRDFSEVFFDDVFVPDSGLLGALHDGWSVAMATLKHERTTANFGRQVRFRTELGRLARVISSSEDSPARLASEIGQSLAEGRALEVLAEAIAHKARDGGDLSVDGAVTKLFWSEAHQRLAALGLEVCEHGASASRVGLDEVDYWRHLYLSSRAETIYAGTSQIQRNIIAKRGLGL